MTAPPAWPGALMRLGYATTRDHALACAHQALEHGVPAATVRAALRAWDDANQPHILHSQPSQEPA